MKGNLIKDKLVFYSGLIYLIIMSVFIGIRICSYFKLLTFPGATYIIKILMQVGFMFVVPVLLYKIFMKKTFKQTFFHFGFRRTTSKSVGLSFLAGLCMFFLVLYFSSMWSSLLELIGYHFSTGVSDYSVVDFILDILFVGCLPAICEETTHRGLVLGGMKHNGGIRAIVLSGLLFALLHLNIVQFGYAFLVGMLLCVVTMVSRSIIPAMIMHFTNNFLGIFLSYSTNSTWLKNNLVDYLLSMFSSSSFVVAVVTRLLIIMLCMYGICWCVASLFKEGKKLDFFTFKQNLKKQIEKNGLQNDVDLNNNILIYNLYREATMMNLEKQLEEQKLTFKDLMAGNAKKAINLLLSEKMTAPERPHKKNYVFFYIAIILGSLGTIASLVLGLIGLI